MSKRTLRYRLDLMTRDGEPEVVARPYGDFALLGDVKDFIAEYLTDTDMEGAYFAIYDNMTETYVEN